MQRYYLKCVLNAEYRIPFYVLMKTVCKYSTYIGCAVRSNVGDAQH